MFTGTCSYVALESVGLWEHPEAIWAQRCLWRKQPSSLLTSLTTRPERLFTSLGFIKIPLGLAPAAHCLSFNAQQQHPFRIKHWPQVLPSWPKLNEETGVDKKRRTRELLQEACRPFPCFYPQGCYNVTSDAKAGQIMSISMSSFYNIYLVILCCKLTKTWLS